MPPGGQNISPLERNETERRKDGWGEAGDERGKRMRWRQRENLKMITGECGVEQKTKAVV